MLKSLIFLAIIQLNASLLSPSSITSRYTSSSSSVTPPRYNFHHVPSKSRGNISLFMADLTMKDTDKNPQKRPGNKLLILLKTFYYVLATKALNLTKKIGAIKNKLLIKRGVNGNNNPSSAKGSNKSFLTSQRGRRPSPLQSFLVNLFTMIMQPAFWSKLVILVAGSIFLENRMRYVKSLTLDIPFSSFLKLIEIAPERVKTLRITPFAYMFSLDGRNAITRPVNIDAALMKNLIKAGIDFYAPAASVNYLGLLWTVLYMGFLFNMATKMSQGPQDNNIGKSRSELSLESGLTFADVAGQDKAKVEVKEICDMLKEPERYLELGARLPAGVLLCGPPGTGKTLLARVSAQESGVPFYAVSASEFVEVFVGRGAARVRKLFKMAADNAPCILFIDELDSIGRSRRSMSMNSEQENTLNQLLTCMDGLDTNNNGVIVMAATNRQELLDPALLRAGRFDRIVQCPLPDKNGRQAILNVHTKRLRLSPEVNLEKIARLTPGTCGADLASLANEAAIRAVRRKGTAISAEDFDNALNTFYAGRGMPISGLAEQLPSWIKGLGSSGDVSPTGSS